MSNPSCLYPRHSACTVQAVEFNFSYSFKTIIKLLCLTIKTSTVEAGGWGVNTSLNQPPIQKCQNFPNESPIVRASRKLPPLVIASHAGVFKIWSLFVCCMYKATQSVLVIQKKLSVTAWNYSCKINLEIACDKIYSLVKSSCVGSSSQKNMVIKPVDKGGGVVVWSHLLYIAKANPQLSDSRFCKHLDHDPLKESQNMVKLTIFEMISDNQRPPSAPSRFYMYLLPTIKWLFPRVVVPPKT